MKSLKMTHSTTWSTYLLTCETTDG